MAAACHLLLPLLLIVCVLTGRSARLSPVALSSLPPPSSSLSLFVALLCLSTCCSCLALPYLVLPCPLPLSLSLSRCPALVVWTLNLWENNLLGIYENCDAIITIIRLSSDRCQT